MDLMYKLDWSELAPESKIIRIKNYRNSLLLQSDWTQLPDAALTPDEREAWTIYRQALRDIPQDFSDPDLVVFPTAPGGV